MNVGTLQRFLDLSNGPIDLAEILHGCSLGDSKDELILVFRNLGQFLRYREFP